MSYGVKVKSARSWDEYFYKICLAAASNSKCFSRQIGAILVRDKSVISTGYNGPPRGIASCDQRWYSDDEIMEKYNSMTGNIPFDENKTMKKQLEGRCPRKILGYASGEGMEWCPAGHAEENAILNAARLGICTKGASMYMTCGIPCSKCLVKIINAGIEELIVTKFKFYDVSAKYLLNSSDLSVRFFDFVK